MLPGCSLEDPERRAQHREACIEAVKRSPLYGGVQFAEQSQHYARPLTPDPRQPEVSKRAWERLVREWRMQLKALIAAAQDEPMYVRLPVPEDVQDEPMYVRMRMQAMYVRMSPSRSAAEEEPEPVRQRPRQRRGRSCAAEEEPEPVQCTEEDWARRSAHRAAGVAAVKRSQDYRLVRGAKVWRPKTPDSTDRALNKRVWERGIQYWRNVLKELVEFHRLHRLLRLDLSNPSKLVLMTDDVGCHWRPPLAMRSWRAA